MQARRESREARLRRFGFTSYAAFIRSPRWQEKRSEYWTDPDTLKDCGICGTTDPPLSLHHRTYERVGAERLSDLMPVCLACHQLVHVLDERGDLEIGSDFSCLVNNERAEANREQAEARVRYDQEQARYRHRLEAGRANTVEQLRVAVAHERRSTVRVHLRKLKAIDNRLAALLEADTIHRANAPPTSTHGRRSATGSP